MSYNSRLHVAEAVTGSTTVTGAPVQTVTGTALACDYVAPGTEMICRFTLGVTTSSLQFTPSLEGSWDGTNYYTLQTGTACTAGTGTLVTSNPLLKETTPAVKYIRGKVVSSGASAVSGDTVAMRWYYLRGTVAE